MDELPDAAGRAAADPAAQARAPHLGLAVEHRSRPRLSVPVLVLHHHQRAGPQEPLPLARRSRDRSSARTTRRASSASSSPTTISPATSDWETLFDRLIELRDGECPKIGFTIQVDTLCHKIPNFIEKAAQAGVRRVFIGLENINPGQSDRRQEAPEQDHRIPPDAAEMARPRRHHLCRLHPRLSRRHQGIDPARHRDHQARAAARHPRILLPDAAARLGGPQGALGQGGLDGPRHEQIRPQSSRRASSARCRMRNGRRPIARPGQAFYTPEHIRTILRRAAACRLGRPRHDAVDAFCGSS